MSDHSRRPGKIRGRHCQLILAHRKSLVTLVERDTSCVIAEKKPDTSALIFSPCSLVIIKEAEKQQLDI